MLLLHVREGSPVVASSNYGSGTKLMTLADLSRPVFRGTVDEIDLSVHQPGRAYVAV